MIEGNENLDEGLEQIFNSRTTESIHRVGHDSIRLKIWMAYYERNCEKYIHFDLMPSGLSTST